MSAIYDMIAKLLAQAEGTDKPAEAEAYTAKAIGLATKYSIDLTMRQARNEDKEEKIVKEIISLTGEQYSQVKMQLASIVSRAFRCETIYVQKWNYDTGQKIRIRYVHVIGFESDVKAVRLLIVSLLLQLTNAMVTVRVPRSVHGKTFRQSFAIGFNKAVHDRLAQMNRTATEESNQTNPGTDLVLVNRHDRVKSAVSTFFPRLRPAGGGPTAANNSGYDKGYENGQKADIGQTRLGTSRLSISG